jgi:hypothetical protein
MQILHNEWLHSFYSVPNTVGVKDELRDEKCGQNCGFIAVGTDRSTVNMNASQIVATALAVNTALFYPHFFFLVSESV